MRGIVARERTVERLERRSVRHAQHGGGHVSERDVGDFERPLHKVAFGDRSYQFPATFSLTVPSPPA